MTKQHAASALFPNQSGCFVIAEIGNNHNGCFERAKRMIDQAVAAGADCVKFQMRNLNALYRQRSLQKTGDDLGTEYILDLLERFELSLEQHRALFDYCQANDIMYMCTPWDHASVDVLESFGVQGYKVASADMTNLPLLRHLAGTNKPLILSTGMSNEDEIRKTAALLDELKVNYALLHCNSTYPAPFHDIHLNWLPTLATIHPNVGYSGHERGIAVSLAAVALGAQIIERHVTEDRSMEGPDHAASLEFDDFARMVEGIRQIEQALGDKAHRSVSQGEMINRENLGKSLVAARDLPAGSVLTEDDILVRSPGQGLSPQRIDELVGQSLKRPMQAEDYFFPSDLDGQFVQPREYNYARPWGVPVRYHDFNEYAERIKPDLFEFHLSYGDMDLALSDYLSGPYECGYVVHAPELFEGSHLMDLATADDEYRKRSIAETQRVIDITRELQHYFPREKTPMIVANIGGFSMDKPLDSADKPAMYQRFAESLAQLDTQGVELIPQTMAPFPWHFGGQRYQNLFVEIAEIEHWCKKLGLRMCFDVSHTRLTCNHFGYDFYDFARRIAPFTAHIHMGDAKGVNGEGLQVGEGDIDFIKLCQALNEGCPNAYFIPEIWQGHKNGGEGFWIALERLEASFAGKDFR